MSKSDAPALRLVVEKGPRLVPASAFDAERLDSYRLGRTLRLTPVEESDRKDIRRWWAILQRAIKDTKTPWRTAAQASEAIKLSLGIVEYGKTVGGQFMQWPKSLKELDDDELAGAVRDMAAILKEMTGVDPLDWHRETADVGEDEQEPSESSPPPEETDAGSGTSSHPPGETAPDQSSAADQEDGAETSDAPSSELLDRMRECLTKFIGVVTDKAVPDKKDRQDNLVFAKNVWKDTLAERPEFVKACTTQMNKVLKGEVSVEAAREYLEGLIR